MTDNSGNWHLSTKNRKKVAPSMINTLVVVEKFVHFTVVGCAPLQKFFLTTMYALCVNVLMLSLSLSRNAG
jgi:hypothetical protein